MGEELKESGTTPMGGGRLAFGAKRLASQARLDPALHPDGVKGGVKRVPCKGSSLRLLGSARVRTYGPSLLIWKCDKGKTPLEASEHSRPPSWIVSSARWGRGRRHKEASRFAGKGLKGGGAADARSLPRRCRLRVWEASGLKPSVSADGAQQRVCIARFAIAQGGLPLVG